MRNETQRRTLRSPAQSDADTNANVQASAKNNNSFSSCTSLPSTTPRGRNNTTSSESLEDAFRRVTSNLAASAWGCERGENPPDPPRKRKLTQNPYSAFENVMVVTSASSLGDCGKGLKQEEAVESCRAGDSKAENAVAGTKKALPQSYVSRHHHHLHHGTDDQTKLVPNGTMRVSNNDDALTHKQPHVACHPPISSPTISPSCLMSTPGTPKSNRLGQDDDEESYNRTPKVSKTSYTDHGDHGIISPNHISTNISISTNHNNDCYSTFSDIADNLSDEDQHHTFKMGGLVKKMTVQLQEVCRFTDDRNKLQPHHLLGDSVATDATFTAGDDRISTENSDNSSASDPSKSIGPIHKTLHNEQTNLGMTENGISTDKQMDGRFSKYENKTRGMGSPNNGVTASWKTDDEADLYSKNTNDTSLLSIALAELNEKQQPPDVDTVNTTVNDFLNKDTTRRSPSLNSCATTWSKSDAIATIVEKNSSNQFATKGSRVGSGDKTQEGIIGSIQSQSSLGATTNTTVEPALSSSRNGILPTDFTYEPLNDTNDSHTKAQPTINNRTTSPVERICYTSPLEPASNNGLDNAEGNLIVHKGDIFSVPIVDIHYPFHPADSTKKDAASLQSQLSVTNFEVVELLGQGTFAQVFRCRDQSDQNKKRHVAIKVIKNKPAYTRQAAVEIDIFKSLSLTGNLRINQDGSTDVKDHRVQLLFYFVHHNHLCLVFELLGLNLYEVLKRRQFRGLRLNQVRNILQQSLGGINELSVGRVVHCDLKPENILLVNSEEERGINVEDELVNDLLTGDDVAGGNNSSPSLSLSKIRLIDFGSACFEGQTTHTYIQSRFYRSPEVLVGLPYDSAIDMWSIGCVAAELFLGLPILPGMQEHDQLGRIWEMIGQLPDWMMEQGNKAHKYFVKIVPPPSIHFTATRVVPKIPTPPPLISSISSSTSRPTSPAARSTWRLKSRQEYASFIAEECKGGKGDVAEPQQPTNRYFKRKKLEDIVMLHGHYNPTEDRNALRLFVHFLKGILDPDPWKRWTANQALIHPFLTGNTANVFRTTNTIGIGGDRQTEVCWIPPWDPSICRRKLMSVEKAREKRQQLQRRSSGVTVHAAKAVSCSIGQHFPIESVVNVSDTSSSALHHDASIIPAEQHSTGAVVSPGQKGFNRGKVISPEFSTTRVTAMTDAMSLSHTPSLSALPASTVAQDSTSPPPFLGNARWQQQQRGPTGMMHNQHISGSLGETGLAPHRDARGYIQLRSQYDANTPTFQHVHHHHLGPSGGNSWVDPQYSPGAGAPGVMLSSAMQSMNGYEFSPSIHSLPPYLPITGPQSFSGVCYDGMGQQLPAEGDLGYALQRPGVVPSIGSANEQLQQSLVQHQVGNCSQQQGLYGYPPQVNPVLSGSLNTNILRRSTNGSISSHSLRRSRGSLPGMASSATQAAVAMSTSENAIFSSQQHEVENQSAEAMNQLLFNESSKSAGVKTAATSLLAQQLEEHSAHHSQHIGIHQNPTYSYPTSSHQQQVLPGSYQHHHGAIYESGPTGIRSTRKHGGYYSYTSSNGTPMKMSAPSFVDPRITQPSLGHYVHTSQGSYGSYGAVPGLNPPYQMQFQQQLMQGAPPPMLSPNALTDGMGLEYSQNFSNYGEAQPPPPPTAPDHGVSM